MAEHVHPVHGKPIGWIYGNPVYRHRHQTGAEIMRRRGLPTAQDLREQYWRRRIAAGGARETTEEVRNLNPCATASTSRLIERRGGSQRAVSQDWTILPSTTWVIKRQGDFSRNKDLGESSGTTLVKNLNPAKTDLSGTAADLEGKSLLKDLGGTSGTVDGYLNPVANLTSASFASTSRVIERRGGSSLNKDLGGSSGTTLVENLNPAETDLSGTGADRKGNSLLKDLGESSEITLEENLNPAETDLSGTRADRKGKSLPKELDESSEILDGYLNSAVNLTGASSGNYRIYSYAG